MNNSKQGLVSIRTDDKYVGFIAKTSLISYYAKTLGAELAIGQRMFIGEEAS